MQLTRRTFAIPILGASVLAVTACHHPGVSGSPSAAAASHVAPGDWPEFNRTLAGDRFSPLAEINRANVSRLGVVCSYKLPEVTALQTGPIVVGGAMYFTTDTISYAIDAAPVQSGGRACATVPRRVVWP
jgi:alcohol dehydrogenase (cytochrome c)